MPVLFKKMEKRPQFEKLNRSDINDYYELNKENILARSKMDKDKNDVDVETGLSGTEEIPQVNPTKGAFKKIKNILSSED
ncbi:hypothetical protein TKK_0014669 [Trichogramma kaykai]